MLEAGFCIYIVTSRRNGTVYTGHTDDLARRASEHAHGDYPGFAKTYGCKHLVWFEMHETREAAFIRERRIKDWKRGWKLRMIEQFNPHWLDIHTCPVWPVPDADAHPEVWRQCMATWLER